MDLVAHNVRLGLDRVAQNVQLGSFTCVLKFAENFKWSSFLAQLSKSGRYYMIEKLLKSSFQCCKPYINVIFLLKIMSKSMK